MRPVRNIAIIVLIAIPVAFLPGGGQVANAVITVLMMAFLATIGFAARQIYRENRLTYDTLPDDQRAVLLGSLGVIVLMIAGADEMLGGGGFGAVLWGTLVACAVHGTHTSAETPGGRPWHCCLRRSATTPGYAPGTASRSEFGRRRWSPGCRASR